MNTILAIYPHGWTGHGHRCCDKAGKERLPNVRARAAGCGGPGRCEECAADREQLHAAASEHGQLLDLRALAEENQRMAAEVKRLEDSENGRLVLAEAENKRLLAEVERLRQELTDLGLREQWAALYPDGTWTSGSDVTSRAEAEEIVAGSRLAPAPRLGWRWISDWQLPDGPTRSVA